MGSGFEPLGERPLRDRHVRFVADDQGRLDDSAVAPRRLSSGARGSFLRLLHEDAERPHQRSVPPRGHPAARGAAVDPRGHPESRLGLPRLLLDLRALLHLSLRVLSVPRQAVVELQGPRSVSRWSVHSVVFARCARRARRPNGAPRHHRIHGKARLHVHLHADAQVDHQRESLDLQPRRTLRPTNLHVPQRHSRRRRRGDDATDHFEIQAGVAASEEPRHVALRPPLSVSSVVAPVGSRPPGRRLVVLRRLSLDPYDALSRRLGYEVRQGRPLPPEQLRGKTPLSRHALVQQSLPLLHGLGRGVDLHRPTQPAGQVPRRRTSHVARHLPVADALEADLLDRAGHDRPLLRLLAPLLRI
mmetsp:Transcript_2906/g.7536  ORF Transcript_2906/g.7536 Transcript_2906/m.7536 type:complete len:359 (+) Transcript_2906:181-1257(+)